MLRQLWFFDSVDTVLFQLQKFMFHVFYRDFFVLYLSFLIFEKLNLSNCQDVSLRPIPNNTSGLDFFFLLWINSTHNIYLHFQKIYSKILEKKSDRSNVLWIRLLLMLGSGIKTSVKIQRGVVIKSKSVCDPMRFYRSCVFQETFIWRK